MNRITCKATAFVCTAFLVAIVAIPVHGWGRDGHQIAGAIAWYYLTDKAKASVSALLGNDDLPAASCWADEVRNQGGYEFSKPLHYINLPRSAKAVDMDRDCSSGQCVVAAIERYAKELADTSKSNEERAEALKFLAHFVQDLHQPLHAGYGDDRGGNSIKLKLVGKDTNLHSVWDSGIIDHGATEHQPSKLAELWIKGITDAEMKQWKDADNPIQWANESFAITMGLYDELPKSGDLDAGYAKHHIGTVEDRLAAAGVRLAMLLNAIFEKSPVTPGSAVGPVTPIRGTAPTVPAETSPSPATPSTPQVDEGLVKIVEGEPCGNAGGKAIYLVNTQDKPIRVTIEMSFTGGDKPRREVITIQPGEDRRKKLGCSEQRVNAEVRKFTWTVVSTGGGQVNRLPREWRQEADDLTR